mmetsp:Transcript_54748/g.159694  ORF Transcript_54748/g.159694 Transcript_54748/m.159694 type:complete len:97 (+) Transcript_54748:195-485(+)
MRVLSLHESAVLAPRRLLSDAGRSWPAQRRARVLRFEALVQSTARSARHTVRTARMCKAVAAPGSGCLGAGAPRTRASARAPAATATKKAVSQQVL